MQELFQRDQYILVLPQIFFLYERKATPLLWPTIIFFFSFCTIEMCKAYESQGWPQTRNYITDLQTQNQMNDIKVM